MNEEKIVSKVWLVRAGRHGEDEEAALTNGLSIIGFREVGNLRPFELDKRPRKSSQGKIPRRSRQKDRKYFSTALGV